MQARTKLIIVAIVTAVVAVYGVELGTRVAAGSGRLDYLVAVVIILVLLAVLVVRFYSTYKKESKPS